MSLSNMKNETILQGLTPEKELALVAKRFNMSIQEAVEAVIHAVYIGGFDSYEHFEIELLERLRDEEERNTRIWTIVDGKCIEDEEEPEQEEDFIPAF